MPDTREAGKVAPHTQIKRLNLDGSKRMERPEPETARTPEDLA